MQSKCVKTPLGNLKWIIAKQSTFCIKQSERQFRFSLLFLYVSLLYKELHKKMSHTFLLVIIGRISLHQRKKIMQLVILAQITKSSAIIEQRVKSTRKEVLHE